MVIFSESYRLLLIALALCFFWTIAHVMLSNSDIAGRHSWFEKWHWRQRYHSGQGRMLVIILPCVLACRHASRSHHTSSFCIVFNLLLVRLTNDSFGVLQTTVCTRVTACCRCCLRPYLRSPIIILHWTRFIGFSHSAHCHGVQKISFAICVATL